MMPGHTPQSFHCILLFIRCVRFELAGNLYFKYIPKGFGFWNEIELAKSFALLLSSFFSLLENNRFRTRILNSILDAAWRGWSNHLSRVLCRMLVHHWEFSPLEKQHCNSSGNKWWLPGFRIIHSVISTNISIHSEHVPYYLHVFSEVPAHSSSTVEPVATLSVTGVWQLFQWVEQEAEIVRN